ncbi:MAG: ergothioneine biosynthesis protein EgtB [Candidatus Dormibacteraeota bacterium]|nr:ergothioneine biosynthesis protein EgtB [Candidatus Dormibacteraeota bacterium]
MDLKQDLAQQLEAASHDTGELIESLDDAALMTQHDPLMSPLVWDYAHVGVYEELWLVNAVSGADPPGDERFHVYDAFENPRSVRASLNLMSRTEVDDYRDGVRHRALDLLEEVDVDDSEPLTREGFVYAMVAQHERQHQETMLQTLQLLRGGWRPTLPEVRGAPAVDDTAQIPIPGGTYTVGSDDHAPYDNEHGRHEVLLDRFNIDRYPVSCRRYLEFMEHSGYARRELWTDAGWAWRTEAMADAPKYWHRVDGTWMHDRFGHDIEVRLEEPVMHVTAHEAEAFATWAGGRLPTEQEWEVAAAWDPDVGRARRFPWGDDDGSDQANLNRAQLGPSPLGGFPTGASAFGCEQMVGDVWEWTSSPFLPYPGFTAFPYREYSEVFFGDSYRVLRGGSWAADHTVARVTFRNWDYPIRRQIFAGFRCADRTLDR